jgi:hypothetical protein
MSALPTPGLPVAAFAWLAVTPSALRLAAQLPDCRHAAGDTE